MIVEFLNHYPHVGWFFRFQVAQTITPHIKSLNYELHRWYSRLINEEFMHYLLKTQFLRQMSACNCFPTVIILSEIFWWP